MRKLISLVAAGATLAGAGIAFAGAGATDSKGRFVDIHVAITPPVAGTSKTPQGVGISFDSFTGNRINGDTPSHNTSVVVRFNKGFKVNGALFPACKINTKAFSTCPNSTRIGAGTAEASIAGQNGAPPTFIPATVVAYNGKPFSGKSPTAIFVASLSGKPAGELDFTVHQQATGPYGLAFTQLVLPAAPPAVFDITKFSVTLPDRYVIRKVHGKSVKVHLLEAPTTCNGSWQFAQTNNYSDGPPLTATDSQPCTKR